MTELRERLDRELSTITPPVGARAGVERRLDRRRGRRRIALPVATLLITVAIVGGLTYAFRPVPPPGPADAAAILMPGAPIQAIVYGDALWAITQDPGCEGPACPGFVVKVDTLRGQVTAQVPVTSPTGLTAGAGSIWLASFADATLIRLDPETGHVEATIPLVLPGEEPGTDWTFLPTHVDASEHGVWVSTARGAVAHIDPATNGVVDVIPLPPETLGGVAIGRDAIWLDNGLGGVIRVDPETHQVEEEGSIDEDGRRLDVGTPVARGDFVWMLGMWARPVEQFGETSYEGTDRQALVSIEGSTGEVVKMIDLPTQPCCAWLLEDRDVWLVEDDGASLRQLDPLTGGLAEPIPVPFGRPLAISDGIAWSAVGQSIRSWDVADASADPSGDLEPLVIEISAPRTEDGSFVSPRFRASYLGRRIPLDAIETPGAELGYPVTQAPDALPAGTSIIIQGEYRDAAVFELRHYRGDYVEEGACLVPTPLSQIPERDGPTAFFIYVEWSDASGGKAFRADVVGAAEASPEADDPETQLDGMLLGLVVCDEAA
jgi:hypothetical protein